MHTLCIQTVGAIITIVFIHCSKALTGAYFSSKGTICIAIPDINKPVLVKIPQWVGFTGIPLAGKNTPVCTNISEIPGRVTWNSVIDVTIPLIVKQHGIYIIDNRMIGKFLFDSLENPCCLCLVMGVGNKFREFFSSKINNGREA